jgi:hypothetical protein
MLLTVIFVPFCCREMLKTLAAVSLLFLLSYSFLPHKELRFIIYVIPLLNACAANTIVSGFRFRSKMREERVESY